MKTGRTFAKLKVVALAAVAALGISTGANAGSIFITGHDVDFHANQAGYSTVILDYLRGAGTGGEIAAGSYNVGVLRSSIGGTFFAPTGFGSVFTADPTSFGTGAAFTSWLSSNSIDVLEIASYTGCGGCDLSLAGSNAVNGLSAEIATFFNAGGDIWANSGDGLSTYYDFLPPGAVAAGTAIGDSANFVATAAGTAIGITGTMINGYPTHNSFNSLAPAFTVFENYSINGQAVSAGIRDATITDTEITVPEPASLVLLGLGLAGLGFSRRKKA